MSLATGNVDWAFVGRKQHTVTENAGLAAKGAPLFTSDVKSSGHFAYRLFAAGTYAYRSTVKGDSSSGTLNVPVSDARERTRLHILCSRLGAPASGRLLLRPAAQVQAGRVEDVAAVGELEGFDDVDQHDAHAALRRRHVRRGGAAPQRLATGKTSGWSPETLVSVS